MYFFYFFIFFDDDNKLLCKGLSLRSQPTRSLFERIVSDKRKVGGEGALDEGEAEVK